ncbi:MAG: redoxin domain-containing protein [Myxococcota bacterium]
MRALLHAPILLLGCSAPSPPAPNVAEPSPSVSASPAPAPPESASPENAPPQLVRASDLPTIQPGRVVPAFALEAADGRAIDSSDLVGQRPFVVMFFATWCPVCEQKMPMIAAALRDAAGADLPIIAGAFDEPETYPALEGYVDQHGLPPRTMLVKVHEHRAFGASYDPFGSFPLIMVIDRNGIIVELQKGLKPRHEAKLAAALRFVQPGAK